MVGQLKSLDLACLLYFNQSTESVLRNDAVRVKKQTFQILLQRHASKKSQDQKPNPSISFPFLTDPAGELNHSEL